MLSQIGKPAKAKRRTSKLQAAKQITQPLLGGTPVPTGHRGGGLKRGLNGMQIASCFIEICSSFSFINPSRTSANPQHPEAG